MKLLLAGLLLFFGVHALPMWPAWRERLAAWMGHVSYRVLFSILSMAGFVLIVFGMYRAPVVPVWQPPAWGSVATALLMLAALYCLVASRMPSRLRSLTPHPMLWGITFWAFGHLLANGDQASMLLFGAFLAYALVDRVSANRRGAMPKREAVGLRREAMVLAATAGSFVVLVAAHPWFAGVAVLTFS